MTVMHYTANLFHYDGSFNTLLERGRFSSQYILYPVVWWHDLSDLSKMRSGTSDMSDMRSPYQDIAPVFLCGSNSIRTSPGGYKEFCLKVDIGLLTLVALLSRSLSSSGSVISKISRGVGSMLRIGLTDTGAGVAACLCVQ